MNARLFVGNLNPRTTEERLRSFFLPVGSLTSVSLPLDRKTHRPRGFGFVEFREREQAEQALATLNHHVLDGRELDLSWARAKAAAAPPSPRTPAPSSQRTPGARLRVERPLESEDMDDDTEIRQKQRPRSQDDYARKRPSKPLGHGKHGSDRLRARGTRRSL